MRHDRVLSFGVANEIGGSVPHASRGYAWRLKFAVETPLSRFAQRAGLCNAS